jgi:hypothetical protein
MHVFFDSGDISAKSTEHITRIIFNSPVEIKHRMIVSCRQGYTEIESCAWDNNLGLIVTSWLFFYRKRKIEHGGRSIMDACFCFFLARCLKKHHSDDSVAFSNVSPMQLHKVNSYNSTFQELTLGIQLGGGFIPNDNLRDDGRRELMERCGEPPCHEV